LDNNSVAGPKDATELKKKPLGRLVEKRGNHQTRGGAGKRTIPVSREKGSNCARRNREAVEREALAIQLLCGTNC